MKGMLVMIAMSIGGGVGWWIGAHAGLMTAFLLSVVGTAVGAYSARRAIREYLP